MAPPMRRVLCGNVTRVLHTGDPPHARWNPPRARDNRTGGGGAPFLFPVGITIREPRLTIGPVTCITFPALRIIKNF